MKYKVIRVHDFTTFEKGASLQIDYTGFQTEVNRLTKLGWKLCQLTNSIAVFKR